jgi:multiple sugar transport system ATP-binding protein
MTMSDRVAVFLNGRLQQVDTPLTIYHSPANQFVAGFVGSPPMNFVTGSVSSDGVLCIESSALGRLPDLDLRPYAGQTVTVGIRPEDVQLIPERITPASLGTIGENAVTDLKAIVQVVEQLGSSILAYLRLGETLVAAQLSADVPIAVGEGYTLVFPPARTYVFMGQDGIALRTPGKPGKP